VTHERHLAGDTDVSERLMIVFTRVKPRSRSSQYSVVGSPLSTLGTAKIRTWRTRCWGLAICVWASLYATVVRGELRLWVSPTMHYTPAKHYPCIARSQT